MHLWEPHAQYGENRCSKAVVIHPPEPTNAVFSQEQRPTRTSPEKLEAGDGKEPSVTQKKCCCGELLPDAGAPNRLFHQSSAPFLGPQMKTFSDTLPEPSEPAVYVWIGRAF